MALSTDRHAQCQRLLEALRLHPVSTIHARVVLDIMAPAARIMELRETHNIITHWTTEEGHRQAQYVLLSGGQP